MEKNNTINKEVHDKLLRNIKVEEEIDDSAYATWKPELQKELPFFWESMEESVEHKRNIHNFE